MRAAVLVGDGDLALQDGRVLREGKVDADGAGGRLEDAGRHLSVLEVHARGDARRAAHHVAAQSGGVSQVDELFVGDGGREGIGSHVRSDLVRWMLIHGPAFTKRYISRMSGYSRPRRLAGR